MTSLERDYVANPCMPYAYFLRSSKDLIALANLYSDDYKRVGQLCEKIKAELKLEVLECHGVAGAPRVNIHLKDLPRLYEIIGAFVAHRERLMINDHTQVTFSPKDPEKPSAIWQQKKLLPTAIELQTVWRDGRYDDMQGCIPLHRDAFWLIEDGKKFAAELRARHSLPDTRTNYIAEHLAEVISKRQSTI